MVFTPINCAVPYSVGLSLKSDEDDALEIDRVIANTMPITIAKVNKPNDHCLPREIPGPGESDRFLSVESISLIMGVFDVSVGKASYGDLYRPLNKMDMLPNQQLHDKHVGNALIVFRDLKKPHLNPRQRTVVPVWGGSSLLLWTTECNWSSNRSVFAKYLAKDQPYIRFRQKSGNPLDCILGLSGAEISPHFRTW